jgi:hypothetical protein
MNDSIVTQIEDEFSQFSISEQLWLIERPVHRVHEATLKSRGDFEKQLALMADDPEIQGDLRSIEQEFSYEGADGLHTV